MASSHNGGGIWARHLDKIGVGGTVLAALCCLGFPALLAVVSAIGLGFLVKNAILVPLLVAFLLIALAGLYLGTRRHGQWWAFGLGLASALLMFTAVAIIQNTVLAGVGIAGLIAASVLNVWLRIRQIQPR